MTDNLIYYFFASASLACVASFLAGLLFGKRKALSEFLSLKQQTENAKRWHDMVNTLNRGGQHE